MSAGFGVDGSLMLRGFYRSAVVATWAQLSLVCAAACEVTAPFDPGHADAGVQPGYVFVPELLDAGRSAVAGTAIDRSLQTEEDAVGTVRLASDGDPADRFEVVDAPERGTLSIRGNTLTYVPEPDFHGTLSARYVAVVGGKRSSSGRLLLNVTPVNDAPTLPEVVLHVAEGADAALTLGDFSEDVDGDALTFQALKPPHFTSRFRVQEDGRVQYRHDGTEHLADRFLVEVCDTAPACAAAPVSVVVDQVNDRPQVTSSQFVIPEGGILQAVVGRGARDDEGSELAFHVVTLPTHARSFVMGVDGSFQYIHAGSETTEDKFWFAACDAGTPRLCTNASATVTIEPRNDAPVTAPFSVPLLEGNRLPFDVRAAVADESAVLQFSLEVPPERAEAFSFAVDGTGVYDHDGSEGAADSAWYRVCDDAEPPRCSRGVINFVIESVNEAPVATDGIFTVAEGQTHSGDLSDLASDAESSALTFSAAEQPDHGSVTVSASGLFTYVHNGTESAADTFRYRACDTGAVPRCTSATVRITVTPTDDAPTATSFELEVLEGGTLVEDLALRATDPDSLLTFSFVPGFTRRAESVSVSAQGVLTYVHNGTENPSDFVQYRVCDDGQPALCRDGLITLAVTDVNDAPVASDAQFVVAQGQTLTRNITSLVSDVEGGPFSFDVLQPPQFATMFRLLGAGGLTYRHDGSANLEDSFIYEVCDDATPKACDTGVVSIVITPVP